MNQDHQLLQSAPSPARPLLIRLASLVAVISALALGAALVPAIASADTQPSTQPATWNYLTNTTPLLTSLSAAPVGSGANAYLETTYNALANANVVGLYSEETITSPVFTWSQSSSQANPSALSLALSYRAALGQLVGLNGGVTLMTGLQQINTSNGHPIGSPTQIDSESITQSSSTFNQVNVPLSTSLLTNGDEYELVVYEKIAPLVQVSGTATIDLQGASLNITPASPPAPTLTAGSAAIGQVTSSGAVATATINPLSSTTTVTVNYGTSTSYGNSVSETIPANSGATAVTLPISGLSPSTNYHAQIVATSNGGTVSSGDLPFTTTAQPSGATAPTIGSSSIDGTPDERDATLGATINTAGQGGTYYVQYGTTTAYGMTTSPQTLPSGTSGGVPVTVDLTGLMPGSTYHAQLVATTAGGTTYGADIPFTTAAATPPTSSTPTIASASSDGTAATVSTNVNPGNTDTQVSVSYGTSTGNLSSTTPAQTVTGGSGSTGLQFPVTGLTVGQTYYFAVTATNADGTVTTAHPVAYTPAVSATPVVGATSSSSVDEHSANLESSIDTGGASATYVVDYGTSAGNLTSQTSPAQNLSAQSGAQSLQTALSGLNPGTMYYAKFVVTFTSGANNGQTSSSQIIQFQTDPASPPAVDQTSVNNAGPTTVDVQTTVDPGDHDTTVYAVYGPTSSYGSQTPSITIPAGAGPTTVTLQLTGLDPNSTYHVQIVTSNADQTVRGADLVFGTASQPSTTTTTSSGSSGSGSGSGSGGSNPTPPTKVGKSGPSCVAAYLTASTPTLRLLRLPVGAEVTSTHALRATLPRGLKGSTRYRLAGGRTQRAGRRGFAVLLSQLRIGHTTRLTVMLPRSAHARARRLTVAIASLPCGARLGAQHVSGSRLAVTVRSAFGARRIGLTVPSSWKAPVSLTLLTNVRTRALRIVVRGRTMRVVGGGRLRLTRHGRTLTLSGLPAGATGATFVFAARGAAARHGRLSATVTGAHGTRKVAVSLT